MFNCFNCGAPLHPNSLECKKCGYSPDVNFMKTCPNSWNNLCQITEGFCNYNDTYQECPVKINAEKSSF